MVGDLLFTGYPVEGKSGRGIHGCLFAVPIDNPGVSSIVLWAKDKAANTAKSAFYVHVRKRTFREDRMEVSDSFLAQVLPYFSSFYPLNSSRSDIEKYLLINSSLRKENHASLAEMGAKTGAERLWQGPWLRLANSAPMAQFGDHRTYFHKGEKVDEQTHLGVDLASLINSPIRAANHGRVIFADRMGIYGLAVVLDHGHGLQSFYAHLSKIDVAVGREVKKGDVLGLSGQTGLAGGDHLHFAVMVNGVFVNPAEWWDEHWIKDNIDRKLVLLG
jgi:murein DD-endopeptidase MepM/ murein hydrolase activator NlpD